MRSRYETVDVILNIPIHKVWAMFLAVNFTLYKVRGTLDIEG